MSNLWIATIHCLPDAQPQNLLKIFMKRGQRAKTQNSVWAAVVNVVHSEKNEQILLITDQDENVLDETTPTMCTTSTTCITL